MTHSKNLTLTHSEKKLAGRKNLLTLSGIRDATDHIARQDSDHVGFDFVASVVSTETSVLTGVEVSRNRKFMFDLGWCRSTSVKRTAPFGTNIEPRLSPSQFKHWTEELTLVPVVPYLTFI